MRSSVIILQTLQAAVHHEEQRYYSTLNRIVDKRNDNVKKEAEKEKCDAVVVVADSTSKNLSALQFGMTCHNCNPKQSSESSSMLLLPPRRSDSELINSLHKITQIQNENINSISTAVPIPS
uniref:Uncharacterized protein n=1 Tax=Lygus hesperus TaxID=30085 RepID=A0A146LU91_LYGHE